MHARILYYAIKNAPSSKSMFRITLNWKINKNIYLKGPPDELNRKKNPYE